MTTSRYDGMFIVFRLIDAVTDERVAEFALPATPAGWSTNLTLPATADTMKVREYRVQIIAGITTPPPTPTHPRRRQHADPHFNDAGGCLCLCYRCVQVRLKEHADHIDLRQYCVCRACSEDCPSEGRIVMESVAKR